MKKRIPFIFILSAIALSCREPLNCDNAELCVKNIGTDTIFYCWGCNYYEDYILPGESACIYVGEVTHESQPIYYFDTNGATYAIPVDDCFVEKLIE